MKILTLIKVGCLFISSISLSELCNKFYKFDSPHFGNEEKEIFACFPDKVQPVLIAFKAVRQHMYIATFRSKVKSRPLSVPERNNLSFDNKCLCT